MNTVVRLLLTTALASVPRAWPKTPGAHDVTWVVVQDDDGEYESHWGTAIMPQQRIRKIIDLGISPSLLRSARICYVVGFPPYHSKSRKHYDAPEAGVVWANVIVSLNGTVAARQPAVVLMSKGEHRLDVPVELLRQGENLIELGWEARDGGTPAEASFGYFYIGIDTDRKTRRSCSTNDGGKTWSFDCLRPGHDPEPRFQGEYLVRLEVALPNGDPEENRER